MTAQAGRGSIVARSGPTIVVTGSESTGKTTLASQLAHHFGATWVPEYARAYVIERLATTGIPLTASDVEPIARGQIAAEDRARAESQGLVVLDTDLVSTVVYARHYYGACPPWIERAALERRADLYLLCDVDVPWVADPARDRPHRRDDMHAAFATTLDAFGVRYITIRGTWDERLATAVAAVTAVLDA